MKQVAIIPARGGSKRIEKKNILDFHGKPMIAWTIEAALKANIFARVVVSTDDEEIAEIARHYGAFVPFLRKKQTDDFEPVSLATIGTLEQLSEIVGEQYKVVVQLMANCPLRNELDIRAAVNHFKIKQAESQISCFKFGWMNPWWAVTLSEESIPTSLFPETVNKRSQDLPALYCPTGAIWIANTRALQVSQTFYTEKKIFCEMPWHAGLDIDDYEDLKMAKLVYLMQQ